MSLDLLVQASLTSGATPALDAAKEARFKLQAALVFLDGKKLGPLRTVDKATFEHPVAHLIWPQGPSVLIRFPDADTKGIDTLRIATEAAQKRALKSPVTGSEAPRAARLAVADPSGATTPARDERRRPVLDSYASAQKLRADVQAGVVAKRKHDDTAQSKADEEEENDKPVAPVFDCTLSEDDRQKRRRLAVACAEERATQVQTRGIGDVSYAQRLQDRADREELIGRINERYAMQRKEVPWNLGGAPVAELRAHLKSITK